MGLWTLCDTSQFAIAETAFHLSFETAMKNNLMTALFGNVFITVKEGFRFEMTYELLATRRCSAGATSRGPISGKGCGCGAAYVQGPCTPAH